MRILVLGVSGMLGRAIWQGLGADERHELVGASRRPGALPPIRNGQVLSADVLEDGDLQRLFDLAQPEVVINAVGLIKQLDNAKDPLQAVPINTLLPHRLAAFCRRHDARLIHVSTDCVFRGDKGLYRESDQPDATDLYGLSKYLGEVSDDPKAITLRTSIIGRESGTANGLVEWFLGQSGAVRGYRGAVFSGLTTVALTETIRDLILPRPDLHGLFHVSAEPINKFDLLTLVADIYGKSIRIDPVDEPSIDRSLNSDRFREACGFSPQSWPEMIRRMRELQG